MPNKHAAGTIYAHKHVFLWWTPHPRPVVNAISMPETSGETDQLSKDIYRV